MKKTFIEEYLDMLGYKEIPLFLEKYLKAPCLVRLKKIGYFCGMDYASKNIYTFSESITRYDHSLSVALLTWKLTKDKKATIASLLHDVSTPCFSHVIDYMNNDYMKQESTEEKTEDIILGDNYLLECLTEDNILPSEIIDFKKYSIVDIDRPMLCTDRLDGLILTGYGWTKSLNIQDVRKIISSIDVVVNEYGIEEICLTNMEVGLLILKTSELMDVYCHSNEDNFMMELLARITKKAIDIEIIKYDDLYFIDEDVLMSRLEESNDIEIKKDLELFRNIRLEDIPKMDMPYVKVRNLNPLVYNKRLKKD